MADAILAAHSIISRADAIAQGLRRYFTGIPCAHGHIAQRSVRSGNQCIACKAASDKEYASRTKAAKAEYDRAYRKRHAEKCKKRSAEYNAKNAESIRVYNAVYVTENADKLREYRARNKAKRNAQKREWATKNAERVSEYKKVYEAQKMASDPNYKLRVNLRIRLSTAIREGAKAGSAVRDLGCTIDELKAYLEGQFTDGMTWENWGRKGWHIDHKKPLAAYDLTDPEQVKEACHYTNLQPLWWRDNIAKGAREI